MQGRGRILTDLATLFKENHGYFTTSQAASQGIDRWALTRLDRDLVIGALKAYMKQASPDKAKLLSYAQVFGIREQVYQYMEVLS